VFNAMHCDGITAVVEENCLGPGEVAYVALSFEVTRVRCRVTSSLSERAIPLQNCLTLT